MAQALMNNLNIIHEVNCGTVDKNTEDFAESFASILEVNSDFKQCDSDIKQLNTDDESNIEEYSQNVYSLSDMKTQQITTDEDTISTIIKSVILETAIETAVDAEITDNCKIYTSNTDSDIKMEESEINNETTQDTITINENEDPTMYNKSNTLEDSTMAVLLQSQTKQETFSIHINNTADKKNILSTENNDNPSVLTLNVNQKENNSSIKVLQKEYEPIEYGAKEYRQKEISESENKINEKVIEKLNVEITDSEASSSNQNSFEDFMNNPSPQEQTIKVMLQGEVEPKDNFENVVKFENVKHESVSPSKIIDQISKQLEKMNNGSRLNMILNPESLGKINLQIISTKGGLIANFTVSTQEAQELLLKGMDGLKDSLLAHGVNVDNVNVKLEETAESDAQSDWTEQEGSRGGYKHQGSQKKKDKEQQFEQMMFEVNNG